MDMKEMNISRGVMNVFSDQYCTPGDSHYGWNDDDEAGRVKMQSTRDIT